MGVNDITDPPHHLIDTCRAELPAPARPCLHQGKDKLLHRTTPPPQWAGLEGGFAAQEATAWEEFGGQKKQLQGWPVGHMDNRERPSCPPGSEQLDFPPPPVPQWGTHRQASGGSCAPPLIGSDLQENRSRTRGVKIWSALKSAFSPPPHLTHTTAFLF